MKNKNDDFTYVYLILNSIRTKNSKNDQVS